MADRIDISARIQAVDQASGTLRAIAGQIKSVGDVAKTAGASLARMATQPFGGLGQNVRGVGSALGNLAGNFRALASPIGAFIGIAGIGGAIAAMKDFMATARQIGRVSTAAGVSPEMVQTWRYMVGDVEAADKSLTMLQKNLANFATKGGKANREIVEVLGKMGISMKDVRSGAIGMDEILPKLAAGFEKNTNATSRARVGQALFGRDWARIVPILAQGEAGLGAAWAEMEKLGFITTEQVAKAGELRTAWKGLDQATNALKYAIASELVPVFQPLIEGLRNWIVEMKPSIVEGFRVAVTALGRGLGLLWQGIQMVVGVMGGWQNSAIALGAVFAATLIPDIGKLTAALLKLTGSVVFNPVTLGALGLAAAATVVHRNWTTIGPWLEQQFAKLSPAAQQAFTAVSNWAQTAWKDIVAGWKKGGLVGAVTAGVISAGKQIYQNWDAISEWLKSTFPEISATAEKAWNDIKRWWSTSVQNIKTAWETGGLGAAINATWEAAKTGATGMWNFIRDEANKINWQKVGTWIGERIKAGAALVQDMLKWIGDQVEANRATFRQIGTNIGNWIKAGAELVTDFTSWLRGLEWESVGTWIGERIGDFLNIELGKGHPEWVDSVAKAFVDIVDTGLDIGLRLAEGILTGLGNKLKEKIPGAEAFLKGLGWLGTQTNKVTESMENLAAADITGLGRRMGWGEGDWQGSVKAANENVRAAERAAAALTPAQQQSQADNVIPFQPRTAAAAPLAPTPGPAVQQPSLIQQMREIPVRLDGEILNRIKLDMSPDLRAMLSEQRAQIADLRTRQSVEIGESMSPALGLA